MTCCIILLSRIMMDLRGKSWDCVVKSVIFIGMIGRSFFSCFIDILSMGKRDLKCLNTGMEQ